MGRFIPCLLPVVSSIHPQDYRVNPGNVLLQDERKHSRNMYMSADTRRDFQKRRFAECSGRWKKLFDGSSTGMAIPWKNVNGFRVAFGFCNFVADKRGWSERSLEFPGKFAESVCTFYHRKLNIRFWYARYFEIAFHSRRKLASFAVKTKYSRFNLFRLNLFLLPFVSLLSLSFSSPPFFFCYSVLWYVSLGSRFRGDLVTRRKFLGNSLSK